MMGGKKCKLSDNIREDVQCSWYMVSWYMVSDIHPDTGAAPAREMWEEAIGCDNDNLLMINGVPNIVSMKGMREIT